jgi:hypothetical protein
MSSWQRQTHELWLDALHANWIKHMKFEAMEIAEADSIAFHFICMIQWFLQG